jgi:Sec-independent protein translocase protein TatA
MLTLRPEEVRDVARAVARYRKSVNDLAAEAQGELDQLVARVKARRASEHQ